MRKADDQEAETLAWRLTFIVAGILLGIALLCLCIAVFRSFQ
jgi:hypothetical protein